MLRGTTPSPEREAAPEQEGCPLQNRKMVLENISKHGTVSHCGVQAIPVAFPMAVAGQCHWQVSLPAGHSELVQHGLGVLV